MMTMTSRLEEETTIGAVKALVEVVMVLVATEDQTLRMAVPQEDTVETQAAAAQADMEEDRPVVVVPREEQDHQEDIREQDNALLTAITVRLSRQI